MLLWLWVSGEEERGEKILEVTGDLRLDVDSQD